MKGAPRARDGQEGHKDGYNRTSMDAFAYPAIPVAASAFLAWGVRGRASNVFAPSIWRGARDRPAVALTFDDGPSEGTPRILEILARHQVRATFFQCGA